ncbi:unnamed protein product, partial [Prorocentrum cordatum]
VAEGHVFLHKEALQQLFAKGPEKRIVTAQEVSRCTAVEQECWKLAAEAELATNFLKMGAFHESTPAERAARGKPPPMTCAWSQTEDLYKCRACVCGNIAEPGCGQRSETRNFETFGEQIQTLATIACSIWSRAQLTYRWYIKDTADTSKQVLGVLVVYADDLLVVTDLGSMRSAFLAAMGSTWTLAKEAILEVSRPLTFLGIDVTLLHNGDIKLHQ